MFDVTTREPSEPADDACRTTATGSDSIEMQSTSSRTRYRDAAMSWLAFGALLAAWHREARLERPLASGARIAAVRENGQRYANQLWVNGGTTGSRSWIPRAPAGVAAMTANAVTSASAVSVEQPEWSSLASVRTARRWLDSRE